MRYIAFLLIILSLITGCTESNVSENKQAVNVQVADSNTTGAAAIPFSVSGKFDFPINCLAAKADHYEFFAEKGSFVKVKIIATEKQKFSMLIRVSGPDNLEIASMNQDLMRGNEININNLYLDKTGLYSILVGFNPSEHTSFTDKGTYQLSITVPHGAYIQDVNPGVGITGNTVVLTGRDFTSSPYIYFTSPTGAQLSYTSDSMTVSVSSITFTMPAFTDTDVVYISSANNQTSLPYTYAETSPGVNVAHSTQSVPMYRENHQYWFSYPQQITDSTEVYLNPAINGQFFTIVVSKPNADITFKVYSIDNKGDKVANQIITPTMKFYSHGALFTSSTDGVLSIQLTETGIYNLVIFPTYGMKSSIVRLDMNINYKEKSNINKSIIIGKWVGPWTGGGTDLYRYGWVLRIIKSENETPLYASKTYFTKLNYKTGKYEIIGKTNFSKSIYSFNQCDSPTALDSAKMIAFLTCKVPEETEPSINNEDEQGDTNTRGWEERVIVIDLRSGRVMNTLKDSDWARSILISPDGKVIYVEYNEGGSLHTATNLYSGLMYNEVTSTSCSFLPGSASFSKDGKSLYSYLNSWASAGIDTVLIKVNPYTCNILKRTMMKEIVTKAGIKPIDENVGVKLFNGSDVLINLNHNLYVYNIDTGELSHSLPIDCLATLNSLSPDSKYILGEYYSTEWGQFNTYYGIVDICSISAGKEIAHLKTDSTSTTRDMYGNNPSLIVAWPNDHTFIYNTTQKLIYFDIIQNKIIKELPIIKPWEQKGWKPVVGK